MAASGDTIAISVPGTIHLNPSEGALQVTKNVTINGYGSNPDADSSVIDGGNSSGLFNITVSASKVTFSRLVFANGDTSGTGARLMLMMRQATLDR